MTADQFERVEQLYFEASQRAPEQWNEFLQANCADPIVRDEVRAMLGHGANVATIRPMQAVAGFDAKSWVGRAIGPYRIEQLLGQGGMGIVFRAEQDRPVRRTVALKLIRPGMDSPEVIARFNSERQALAMMSHANVARVFDAGTADDGRHYFVMEYVAGEPITTFCDMHRLTTHDRLDLFMHVCDAVQHAHHKGIIHRDLKPSNVLVAMENNKAVPKVIDFGIAKAVEQAATGMAAITRMHQPIGTPQYMSPEQASMGAVDVDTRTDVYSLGVLLYELLAGAKPFAGDSLDKTAFDEVRRIIREVDPPVPSSRLSGIGATIHNIAEQRQADPGELVRMLRGELDWITMKAIEKDRARRYNSPADLASDVKRYIDYEPVSAGPPTIRYRVRKFVRRHRVGVLSSTLIVLALVGGMITTTLQLVRARRAEADANAQKARAEARFNDVRKLAGAFMFDVDETLQTAGPTKARQKLVNTSIEYLDSLAAEAGDDPKLLGELCRGYMRVGNVQFYPGFASLGDPHGALKSYRRALEIGQRGQAIEPISRDARNNLAACWDCIAETQFGLEDRQASLASFESAQKLYEQLSAEAPDDVVASRNVALVLGKIGDTYRRMREYDTALALLEQSLSHRERLRAAQPESAMVRRDVALAHSAIGSVNQDRGFQDKALARYEKSLEECRALLATAPDNPVYQRDISRTLDQITNVNLALGHAAAAVKSAQECVEIRQRAVAVDPSNARAVRDLGDALKLAGDTYMTTGRTSDALASYEKCLDVRQNVAATLPESVDTQADVAVTFVAIADVHRMEGRWSQAVDLARQGAAMYEKVLVALPDNVAARNNLALARAGIGESLFRVERVEDALESLQQAIDVKAAGTGPGKPPIARRGLASLHTRKARIYMELNRADEGAESFRRATEIASGLVNVNANDRRAANELTTAQIGLGDSLIKSGKPDEAAPIVEEALKNAEAARAAEPTSMNANDSCRRAYATMGELELARQRPDAAARHYRAAIALAEEALELTPGRASSARALQTHRERLKQIESTSQPVEW